MILARTLLLALLLAMIAAPALAQQIDGEIGNLNEPAAAVPDILLGDQSLAYLVFPDQQVSCPADGFRLEFVRTYLEFTPEQVPVTLNVAGGLLRAVPAGDGFVPGDPIFLTDPEPIVITEPGLQVIEVPTGGAATCEPLDEPCFLTVQFVGPAESSLVIDDQPAPGIEFIDDGTGWVDMFTFDLTSGGKVIIWGDIVCCIVVSDESRSWHGIKQLFR